jgi:hypothetical protein
MIRKCLVGQRKSIAGHHTQWINGKEEDNDDNEEEDKLRRCQW